MTPSLFLVPLVALAADDFEVTSTKFTADATPYLSAMADRFLVCLAAEGTEITPADEATVRDALTSLSTVLARAGGSDCTTTDEAVARCAGAMAAYPCTSLHSQIQRVIDGDLSAGAPAWSIDYASALSGRVESCYTEETGLVPDAAQSEDLATWRSVIAGTLGQLQLGCAPIPDRLAVCTAEIGAIPCSELAAFLATEFESETASFDLKKFMATCDGWLDCGQLEY